MMPMPPKPSTPPKFPSLPKAPAKPTPNSHTPKTFSVQTWTGDGEGKKILIYGPNGLGKTTLASMAPGAIFIGFDDGGRETRNPKTGEPLQAIPNVESFLDLRDVVHQSSLFARGSTLVIDTITKAETLIESHVLATVRKDDGGSAVSIEDYGWGKGYKHMVEIARLLLSDLDGLVRKGVNIVLLAQQSQATIANLEGTDYVQDGPLLTSQPKAGSNVRSEVCSWVDSIFRIGYPNVSVIKANPKATKGKASGSTERQIFTEPEVYFLAKNRMNGTLPPVVSFATRDDDSIWGFIFPQETR